MWEKIVERKQEFKTRAQMVGMKNRLELKGGFNFKMGITVDKRYILTWEEIQKVSK